MNLHEYQAKHILAENGLPVSKGYAVSSVEEAIAAIDQIGGDAWVIKAQVHAGGRGKAGGVKVVKTKDEAADYAKSLLGTRLVTFQTDEKGQPINKILVEACTDIDQELYLGAVVDRKTRRIVFMASTEGGMEIETVAHETPEKIFKAIICPIVGAQPYQARDMAFKLGLSGAQVKQFTRIFMGLAKLFESHDFSLLEINPLVITQDGMLHCLDCKVTIDESALYRQGKLSEMRDVTQEDPREQQAHRHGLSYISLEGDIGCLVNGAGLAMATMDIIKLHGGQPANFLDVGGGANKERVSEAFKIILSDNNVKAIFVNIFGGIVRCDMIAQGIIAAVEEVGVNVPVVVRLQGNNADLGLQILKDSGLNILAVNDFTEAATTVVSAVNSGSQVKSEVVE